VAIILIIYLIHKQASENEEASASSCLNVQ